MKKLSELAASLKIIIDEKNELKKNQ